MAATDKLERIIRCPMTMHKPWFQTVSTGQRYHVTEEFQAMQVWSAVLQNKDKDEEEIDELQDYKKMLEETGVQWMNVSRDVMWPQW